MLEGGYEYYVIQTRTVSFLSGVSANPEREGGHYTHLRGLSTIIHHNGLSVVSPVHSNIEQ